MDEKLDESLGTRLPASHLPGNTGGRRGADGGSDGGVDGHWSLVQCLPLLGNHQLKHDIGIDSRVVPSTLLSMTFVSLCSKPSLTIEAAEDLFLIHTETQRTQLTYV